MTKDIQQFRLQLVDRIRHSKSRVQAILMIDAAVKSLLEKNTHGHIIIRFMERLNNDVDELRDKAQDEMQKILHTASTRLRFLREKLFITANTMPQ